MKKFLVAMAMVLALGQPGVAQSATQEHPPVVSYAVSDATGHGELPEGVPQEHDSVVSSGTSGASWRGDLDAKLYLPYNSWDQYLPYN